MPDAAYISLAEFAATLPQRRSETLPSWVHAPGSFEPPGLDRLEELLDTVVALQRAEWLQDGLYVGPRAMGSVYRDLLDAARTLGIGVPPAVVAGVGPGSQGTFGTDDRPFLLLSSFFLQGAPEVERRFLIGRLCGHVRARHVTWGTLYALLVDQDGLARIGRRTLGPALEIVLAPLSLGARLALSRWHRAAEITADRAGLVVCGDAGAARRAMLRVALGVRPDVDPADYLDTLKGARADDSPGRWAELLASHPFVHKRMAALDLFARSEPWVALGGTVQGEVVSADELARRTDDILAVG